MKADPVIDEIRRVRHAMSAEIGHDPRKLLDYYADLQNRCQDRLVDFGDESEQGRTKARTGEGDNAATDSSSFPAIR